MEKSTGDRHEDGVEIRPDGNLTQVQGVDEQRVERAQEDGAAATTSRTLLVSNMAPGNQAEAPAQADLWHAPGEQGQRGSRSPWRGIPG